MSRDEYILQEIIALGGDCIKSTRCRDCPLKSQCLSQWLTRCPSRAYRLQMALSLLARITLIDDTGID